jgi:peptidoglycan/xylan/chitin deacetylase (PgdA/CDA1 family)
VINIRYLFTVLIKYNYKAFFFFTTSLIENKIDFIDWKQVRELCRKGHDVQSHGKTLIFYPLNREEICKEWENSGEIIYSKSQR